MQALRTARSVRYGWIVAWAVTVPIALATSQRAAWTGNFRELSASVTRMVTLADAGRTTEDIALHEIGRLVHTWSGAGGETGG